MKLGQIRTVPAWLVAGFSGICMGATVAPIGAFPLAWVALAPLWVLVRSPRDPLHRRQRAWFLHVGGCALAWGLGYHGVALVWITHLHPLMWLGIPWLGSVAIALGVWLFIALWGAAWVVLWSWICGQLWGTIPAGRLASSAGGWGRSLLTIVTGVSVWCGLEWGWSLGPLFWSSISYTQSPHNLAILHLGQLSGPFTVTAAIVAVNGCWAEAWLARTARGEGPRTLSGSARSLGSLWGARSWAIAGVALLSSLHLVGWSLQQLPLPDRPDAQVSIGIIQGHIPNQVKLDMAGIRLAQERYIAGYRTLAAQGADIVLTPEGALPIVWRDRNQAQNPIYQAVVTTGVPLWLGTFRPVDGSRAITQSLITLTGQPADPVSQYNKTKLVPLGEYVPFEALLGQLVSRISAVGYGMVPGDQQQIFETPVGQAAVGICYESAFPSWFQRQVQQGAEFILTASNNDPYPDFMMRQHHALDVMRAIEHRRWMVRGTNTGISGVVTPRGETQWLSRRGEVTHYLTTITRLTDLTPYSRWGNWLTPLLVGLTGGGWGWLGWRSRRD